MLVWSGGGSGTCPHRGSLLLDRLLSIPCISSGRTQWEASHTGSGRERNQEYVKPFCHLVVLKLVAGALSGSIGLISDGMDAARGDPGTLA